MLKLLLYTRPGTAGPYLDALRGLPGLQCDSVHEIAVFRRAAAVAEVVALPMYLYDREAAQALRAAGRLRWIQSLSAGVDRLAEHPPPPHVMLTTAGHTMAPAIAEHGMALLLALQRRLPVFLQQQAQARWDAAPRREIAGLRGQLMVIVGYGGIGAAIALRAKAFGMRVVGLRRHPVPDGVADEVLAIGELDGVLAGADVVVVTAPLAPETRGLIDARRLAAMRRGALLLNLSRGAVVDAEAVADALGSGQLGGAGFDVVDPEPLPAGHRLWKAPNLVLTPHVAASGSDVDVAALLVENLRLYMHGRPLLARHEPSRS